MKKRLFILAIAAAVIVFVLTGCTGRFEKNPGTQILNFSTEEGDFYYGSNEALAAEWDLSAGNGASTTSVFSTNADGLRINTQNSGYAVASQKVYLKANADYKITYTYDVDSISDYDDKSGYTGFYIGFLEDPAFNIGSQDNSVHDTSTSRAQTDTFYFHTDSTRGEFNLAVIVGSESDPVSAVVTINDLKLELVGSDVSEETMATYGYYQLNNAIYGFASDTNVVYVVLGGVATLLLAYACYMLRGRSLAFANVTTENRFFEKLRSTKWAGMLLTLGIAGLVRVVITLVETAIMGSDNILSAHFGYDLSRNAYMGTQVATHGTVYLYEYYYTAYSTMLPLQMYLNAFAGLIGRGLIAIGLPETDLQLAVTAVIKLIAVAADLATVALIYKILAKRHDRVAATIMSSFYALVPITFSLSSAWGSYESVSAMFIVLAFYFLLNKASYTGMAVSYFFAAMTSVSALYVVPAVLFYTAYVVYRGIREKNALKIAVPFIAMVGGLVLFYLISLPFVYNQVAAGDAFNAFDRYIATVKGANLYTANAFNFQGLLGNNFEAVGLQSEFVTILYIAFVVALLGVAYFRSRNRIHLTLVAASGVIALWTFGNNMTPDILFAALPLLFITAAILNDKRLFLAFTAYAAFNFVNVSYVYLVSGYDDTGILAVSYETTAIIYVFGALSLLAIIYYVVLAYDVLVNNRVSEQRALNLTYGEHVAYTARKVFAALGTLGGKAKALASATGEAIKEVREERKSKKSISAPENENPDEDDNKQ